MTINYLVPQSPEKLSARRAFNENYPPFNLAEVTSYSQAKRGDHIAVISLEFDGYYITRGTLSGGWDFGSKTVIATPQIGLPAGVGYDLSVAILPDNTFIAALSFDLAGEDYPQTYFCAEGDPIETGIGGTKDVTCFSPSSTTEAYIYYLLNDGLYSRNSLDNYLTPSNDWPYIVGATSFTIFLGANYRVQIRFTGGTLA